MNPQTPQPTPVPDQPVPGSNQPTPLPQPNLDPTRPPSPAPAPVVPPAVPAQPASPAADAAQAPVPAPAVEPLVYPQTDPEHTATPPDSDKENKRSWLKSISLGVLNWLVIPGLIVLFLHLFVFQAFHVIGSSMANTMHDNDYLIISKIGATQSQVARFFKKDSPYIPKRQQVIVFHYPQDPSLVFIKRVIGIPGDRVVVRDGKITVYNKEHPDGYNPDKDTNRTVYPTEGEVDEVVPPGNVFVVGDNRSPNGSYDSREWGLLPSRYIIGDTVLRLIPVNQITMF